MINCFHTFSYYVDDYAGFFSETYSIFSKELNKHSIEIVITASLLLTDSCGVYYKQVTERIVTITNILLDLYIVKEI